MKRWQKISLKNSSVNHFFEMLPLKKSIYYLKILFGLSLFCFLIFYLGDYNEFSIVFRFGLVNVAIVWTLTVIINLIAAYRWYLILGYMGEGDIPFYYLIKTTFLARFSGQISSQIIGDFGVKTFLLKQKSISIENSLTSILWDKSFEILLLFSVLLSAYVHSLFNISVGIFWIIVLCTSFFFLSNNNLFNLIARLVSKFKKNISPKITFPLKGRFIIVMLSLSKYFLVVLRFLILLLFCQMYIPFKQIFIGTSFAQLGLLVGLTPGGLGLVETGWAGYLNYLSIQPKTIALFLFSQRIIILLIIMITCFFIVLAERAYWPYKSKV